MSGLTNQTPGERVEAIKEQIRVFEDECNAIVNAACEQGRDNTEEEQNRLKEILGPELNGEGDCLVAKSYSDLNRWEAIATMQSKQTNERREIANFTVANDAGVPGDRAGMPGSFPMNATKPVTIPAEAQRYKPVKYFQSAEEAYAVGQWALATLFKSPRAQQWCDDHGITSAIRNQQSIGTPADGGYLVPTPLERAIIEIREMYGIMAQDARIYSMSADTLKIPKFATGLVVAGAAELSDMATNLLTKKTWSEVKLDAEKYGGFAKYSTEVGEDAIIDLGQDLARDFGIAFANWEDDAGFNGDGATAAQNNITGIREALLAGSVHVPAAGKLTPEALEMVDYETVAGLVPNVPGQHKWYCHRSTFYASIHPLLTVAGGNTIRTLEDGAQMPAGADFMFLGYPGSFVNVMPKAGDFAANVKGVVIFGDLNQGVAFGQRRGVSVRQSEHFLMGEDAIAVLGTARSDIIVHETGTASVSGIIAQITLPAA